MKKILSAMIFLFTLTIQSAFSADVDLDPTYLRLKVYKFSVSESALCTNPVTIFSTDSPSYINFLESPSLGSGNISNGTYPCIIIEFADAIQYSPSASSDLGNCVADTAYTMGVCQAGSTATLTDGTSVTCTSGEDRVAMYISTASTSTTGADAFNPPVNASDSTYGFNLASALTISGTSSGKFVVNATDKICDGDSASCNESAGSCGMMPPLFSFTKE